MVRYAQREREKAIILRERGLSYRQILEQVPVAKSTLSVWLASVRLSRPQKQLITQKRIEAALRGAATRRRQRLENTEKIIAKARKEVGMLSRREIWLMGAVLYWAEGSKQRAGSLSQGVAFNNSDPTMLRFFKDWLIKIVGIPPARLKFELYLHESQKHRLAEVKAYWIQELSLSSKSPEAVYFKKNVPQRVRKNPENGYYGLVRIRVRSGTELNRTIAGWIKGIAQ